MHLLLEQWLLIIGAGIFGVLGTAYLIFTFGTDKVEAFDSSVTEAMKRTSPRISKDTSAWRT
ncbi:MAG: hypothetical protein ACI82A_001559 [Candidatus Azotimanducaceae bacterium]|jgi:hypothetical protein